jgi:alkanesulfonate monooxygenase SsuD/methylene tetrahydromethanopterin reductase-like flavin-dependent oxidoreductase (luciferase family)
MPSTDLHSARRKRSFKAGLVLPQWNNWNGGRDANWADIREFSQHAEAVGFDSLWVTDHFQLSESLGFWESWSILSAVAEATERVEIGPLVANTGYRNPPMLARVADTIDEISGGRLILGLGAGDFEPEHVSYGYRWDHRVSRFEEALQIIKPMLQTGRLDFKGEYYTAKNVVVNPRGPRESGPPILIGSLGHGPRMLRLTMQYADLWNAWLAFGSSTTEALIPILERIDAACEKHQRDPSTLERTASVGLQLPGHPNLWGRTEWNPITGTTEEVAEQFQAFIDLGISQLIIMLGTVTTEGIDFAAEALELLETN